MSLIWDIVQSVERRAAMPLRQRHAGICSHRQLTFSGGSETLSQQRRSTSAIGVADSTEQTRLAADVDTSDTAASASEIIHPQNTVSEEDKQKTDGLQELDGGNNGREQPTMQQQLAAIPIDQHATSEVQVSSTLSAAGNQSEEMDRNTKTSHQQVIDSGNTRSSSGTVAEHTSASISTDELMVPGSGTTPNTEHVTDDSV